MDNLALAMSGLSDDEAEGAEGISNANEISLEDVLAAWGMEQFTSNFKANNVDLADLCNLADPDNADFLKCLIPSFGPAMRFKKNVRELFGVDENANKMKSLGAQHELNSSKSSNAEQDSSLSNSLNVTQNSNPSRLLTGSNSATKPSTSTDTLTSQHVVELGSAKTDGQERVQPGPSTSGSDARSSESGRNVQRPPQSEANKKRCRESSDLDPFCVRDILDRGGYGRSLLRCSTKDTKLTQEADRNRLADLIIDALVIKERDYKLKPEDFETALKQVLEIFPDEKPGTYYVPYKKEGHVRCLAKGKLVTKYYTLRKHLKSCGIISVDHNAPDENLNEDDETIDLDGIEMQLKFLRENIEPFEKVLDLWKETSKYRVKCIQSSPHLLTKDKKPKKGTTDTIESSVATYLALFPGLKDAQGFKLFEIDFNGVLYPRYDMAIYAGWDDFITTALSALKKIEKPCDTLKDNLLLIEDDTFEKEINDLIVMLSLGYLDTVVTVSRVKQDKKFVAWRPPHSEIQEGLISLVESVGRMETFILNREKKLKQWKIPLLPFCVAVGSSISDVDHFYVVLDNKVRFDFTSAQRALDVCFKIIHACHARYSYESQRLWMLLQLKLYDLKTPFDQLLNDAQLPKLLEKFE